MSLLTRNKTDCVRQLQRSLYCKSKQEKEVKFYSLYDKIYREDVLWMAWKQVKENKGSPGVDGKSIDGIVKEGKEKEMINKLLVQLRNKEYKFSPVRRVDIPKPKGGTRPLGIATIEDRVVQTAIKLIIEPIFEADFHECSYGYRPKRSAMQASEIVKSDLYDYSWGVVEVDLKAYFTSIPHQKLLKLIGLRIVDKSMLKIIKQTLKVGVNHQGNIEPTKIGVPQGSPLSPLYSNIYLNVLDQVWHKRDYPNKLGATIHRYADDIVLVCRKSAFPVLEALQAILNRMDLVLNRDKTKITRLKDGFDFIGYHFVKRKSPTSGKSVIYINPSKTSQQNIRNRIKYFTKRRAPIQPNEFLKELRPVVLGWVNYFKHTNASDAFRKLQRFINARFRRYLNHRSKGRGFGWKRFPNAKLYAMGMVYIGSGIIQYSGLTVHGLQRRLSDRRIREN